MTPTKRRYTFWINDTEADGLRRVKADEGIAESEQIRQAIRDWLRKKQISGKSERKQTRNRRDTKGGK